MKQTGMVLCAAVFCLLRSADAAPLLASGGFETGGLAEWTVTGSNALCGDSLHAASYSARFGAGEVQTLSLDTGTTYELSSFIANFGGSDDAFRSFSTATWSMLLLTPEPLDTRRSNFRV